MFKYLVNCGGTLMDLSQPLVMGIMNITPDSFYPKSRVESDLQIVQRAEQIVNEGGKIIDMGAYSSRPGADHISEAEELNRLIPAIALVRNRFPEACLSIDTFRSGVISEVYRQFGAIWVNDISAGTLDPQMLSVVGQLGLPYIAMHLRGVPQDMDQRTNYDDIVLEVTQYFVQKYALVRQAGIKDVIIDPGFGFAKTVEQNYTLLNGLDRLQVLELPILVGLSRKSMFYKPLEITATEALPATIAGNTIALTKGANILRVHDVKEAVQVVQVTALASNA